MKHFFYLIGGSTFAQLVTIALSPLLSRVYTPEAFGVFGFLVSIIYFVNSFSLMRLEVELLKNNFSHADIHRYSLTVLSLLSLLSLLIVLVLDLSNIYIYIPVLIFLSGFYNLGFYNLLSQNDIKKINKNKIILAFSIGISQFILGSWGFSEEGLILGHIIGFLTTLFFMQNNFFGFKFKGFFIKFKQNIFVDSPSMALSMLSNHGPTSLVFLLMGGAFGGAYYMAYRIVILPISVISTSFSNYVAANFSSWGQESPKKQAYILKNLVFLTIIPIFIIYFTIDELMVFFLGEQWGLAGEIAKLSISWLYLRFFFDSLMINFSLLEKSNYNLYFQIFSLLLRLTSIILPYSLGLSGLEIIRIFCLVSLFAYFLGLILVMKVSKIKSLIFSLFILFFVIFILYFSVRGML